MSSYFFNDLLGTIVERGRSIIERGRGRAATDDDLADLAETWSAGAAGFRRRRGGDAARWLRGARPEARVGFFEILARALRRPARALAAAARAFLEQPDDAHALRLHDVSRSRRQELIRRLNRAPGGTAALVAMRADLLRELRAARAGCRRP
ncbi:MAG: malonyl-CoA decarboxylase N-terminal domain-containing protein [Geminicoccaceae bacterium]